ncbi:MAG: hypothetical protein AAF416_18230 [Pseudomonadota bacterium]
MRPLIWMAVIALMPAAASGATLATITDATTGGRLLTNTQSIPDAFASVDDMFGWRTVGTDSFPDGGADDTTNDISGGGISATDDTGVVGAQNLGDTVFGVVDLDNPDNPSGAASATWTIDISGATNIEVALDAAAMGDFDNVNDAFSFTASIDGGGAVTLFDFLPDQSASLTYGFDNGTTETLDDPLVEQNSGLTLGNDLTENRTGLLDPLTFASAIAGTGSILTLTFLAENDGGEEAFFFDDIVISGDLVEAVPLPASALLLLGALAAFARFRGSRRMVAV